MFRTQRDSDKFVTSKRSVVSLVCTNSLYFRIYVNTGYGGTPSQDSPEESPITGSNFTNAAIREPTESSQVSKRMLSS